MRIPERGDIVWINFDLQSGREQAGRRQALVLTPSLYNQPTGLAVFCPIASEVKGYSFEVPLPKDLGVQGAVLSDHVRSMDWRTRKSKFICVAPAQVVGEVTAKVEALVGGEH
jgi:mRNA interferase MazF